MAEVKVLENGNVRGTVPMSFRSCSGRKRIEGPDPEPSLQEPLLVNLARAFRWQSLIDEGHFSNVNELANAVGKDRAYVARVLRVTLPTESKLKTMRRPPLSFRVRKYAWNCFFFKKNVNRP